MANEKGQTYDFICFTDLAYEFDFSEKNKIEKKIKRRLKYYGLDDYNQERVDYLRQLRNDLYSEISGTTKSRYFHKSKSNFADFADFDFERMVADFNQKYEKVEKNELIGMLNFAIVLFYLR
jgi:hypothetical protein